MNGEDAMVTLLFVDIRDFTPFADRATARDAIALLNEVFGVVVPVLEAHGGHANSSSATACSPSSAPPPPPDHADRAVAAAGEIAAASRGFGTRCRISIGINSGLVMVGTSAAAAASSSA